MKSLFTLFLISLCLIGNSQEITILDEVTNETIPGVAVFNTSKTKSAFTGLDGKVSIDIFSKNEKITFQHLGHVTIAIVKSKIDNLVYLSPQEQDLDEIVISASKFEQSKREVPQKIISIKANDIVLANPQTSADLLGSSGQVFIQKSQLGGGSPMIRGFSTNRLLISVDDVRMNTAIFRGGNVQNIISIDPFSVQNTEVILGAGSVIYGSDAIGGVMNFYTKKPMLSSSNNLEFNANVISRYATASKEKTGHLDFNLGWEKWASYTSISYTDFDDLKMGKYGPSEYLRPEYIETINGVDVIKQNSNPRVQKFTGYNQINFLEKLHYQADKTLSFDLGLHYTATSDYPRYDRLIRYRGNSLRSAEWSYGPQKWFLGNLKLTKYSSKSNLYDKIKATVAYQNFQESRIDRYVNALERRNRKENVDVLSGNLDFEKTVSERSNIFYGFEYIYNKVHSTGKKTNIVTNQSKAIASRYPNGSSWQSAAAYFSYKFKPNKKFTFQSGIRYNHIKIDANFTDNNEFYNFPFNDTNLSTGAFTATAGISWSANEILQWKLNGTSAFRAPNIDDVGKVFDSEPGSVVVPNSNLKPEYAYGGELGLVLNFSDDVVLDLSTYYTYLDNALVRREFTVNGDSQMMYDGELSDIQAIQNASKAWIYGFEAGVKVTFSDNLKLTSQYSVIGGTEEEKGGVEVPIRHVAPSFGNTHLTWGNNKFKWDAFANYNGELSFYQLAPSEADKDYIYAKDKNGNSYAPSWYTLNFRSQYQISESTSIVATIENITNQLYRPYSSGVAASGTNVIVSLKYTL
ncbi:TonB-dependent receptor [Pontimicrobium aquaticum]|uniref:TonB-dependent receptor n=1 Tax=Pontimicrobium aquaticum TaxID=2565367 RepID=A0A4U0F2Y0_9FLAO|nr:TonB-dependent receptor [Pontimicrobium aquaticum]TJY38134.1 TonB-dependent receptor [Pontimicrobium aquaticum]